MENFGEFLYALRKEKGMTQAELARELGVTNKAVSKWETGEAMPETALLLPISRIFGVSVDELLAGRRNEKEDEERKDGEEWETRMKDHLFTRGKDDKDEKTVADIIGGALSATVVFAGILIYLLLGGLGGLWDPYWVIIPACALCAGIIGIIFDACNARKREAKYAKGENPVIGAVCGIIMLLSIISYLLLGALCGLWHPLWLIPIAGAFVCAVTAMAGEIIIRKRKK